MAGRWVPAPGLKVDRDSEVFSGDEGEVVGAQPQDGSLSVSVGSYNMGGGGGGHDLGALPGSDCCWGPCCFTEHMR